ncbi:histidine kinase dimerization/phospho-acceptor domain-containing protein [Acetobacter sp.]|uniref:histidine kinase dimerization/phospho-acceptor domain-containing protein n=1 Tax=Acetobacter sp. TaxID=440 RepID=UPI00387EDA5E
MAHEINQPLSAIATFAQSGSRWLRRPNPDIEEALSCLRQIDENARRAGDIIRNFRELTRIEQVERRTSLDLKKLTQEAIAIVNFGEYSGKVEIQRAMGGEYP